MYHIKSDKRMESSAKLIVEALMTCLETKNFEEITIVDIQHVSGVSRSTFYRLFDNLSDVITYQTDQLFIEMVSRYQLQENINTEELMNFFVHQWLDNIILLDTLITCHREEILLAGFERSFIDLKEFLLPNEKMDEISIEYFISLVASVVVGGLKTWIKLGKKETAEQLLLRVQQATIMLSKAQK